MTVTLTTQTPISVSAQPSVAEKPVFWWLKQRGFICFTSQGVLHGQCRADAAAGPHCRGCRPFLFSLPCPLPPRLYIHAHHFVDASENSQAPTAPWASGRHSRWEVVYRQETRVKQLLKNKQRQKKAPPAQALSLPDLPNTLQLDSYPHIPDDTQDPYNKCGSI